MLFPQHRLTQPDRLSMHLFRLLVPTLGVTVPSFLCKDLLESTECAMKSRQVWGLETCSVAGIFSNANRSGCA